MDYDLALHNTRVLNDGGSVPNLIQAESYIKYLKDNSLWDNCVYFGIGGSKIEPNTDNSCRKLYDLKGNADVFNSTATGQPRYNQDGSLQFDNGDNLQSDNLLTGNPIRNITTNMTVAISALLNTSLTTERCMFVRWGVESSLPTCLWILEVNTAKKISVILSDGITSGFNKVFACNNVITSGIS